ncbi:MAG: alpha/beta hydrolase [Thermodesulfobacteriota bacterium]|nr:alpha/beta hydrolase [Thermodesulfobacteriota bacterium]
MEHLKRAYENEHSRYLDMEGMTLHYRDEGEGPVLLLLHGVCASLHTWDGWVDELKHHYRLIRLDLPGFGLSSLHDKRIYNRAVAVRLMDRLCGQIGLKRFSIAGNSLGGYLAWTYAAAHPEKVEKLILIDPAGFPMSLPWVLRFATHPFVRPFARFSMPRLFFNLAVNQAYGERAKIKRSVRRRYFELAMRNGGKRDYIDIFMILKKELRSADVAEGITKITAPALVMWGEADAWIPHAQYFHQWRQVLPNGHFITYKGAGHVPMEEIPIKTARDAHRFLEDTASFSL